MDDVFELLAWNQGIGYFSSEIGPSTLFAAYKTIKNMEKQEKYGEAGQGAQRDLRDAQGEVRGEESGCESLTLLYEKGHRPFFDFLIKT